MAELPALAVRPELQGNSLGRLLLALLEDALREAGVRLVAMPALVPFPSSSPKQGLAPDGQITPAGISEQVRLWGTKHFQSTDMLLLYVHQDQQASGDQSPVSMTPAQSESAAPF